MSIGEIIAALRDAGAGSRSASSSAVLSSAQLDQAVDLLREIGGQLVARLMPSGTQPPILPPGFDPPPMPERAVTRFSVFGELARQLDSDPVLAVLGYPDAGKTVAVAQFATDHPWHCRWISVPGGLSERAPDDCELWFRAVFRIVFGAESDSALRDAIRRSVEQEPLLLVVDDSHRLPSLDPLRLVFDQARATPARLKIVLLGQDDPGHVSRVRGESLANWRLPGFSENEAVALFQNDFGALTELHRLAIEIIRFRADGHAGMLRASREVVARITDEAGLNALRASDVGTIGDQAHLRASLLTRLRESLALPLFELCRRLSVAVVPFPRELGRALWDCQPPDPDFPTAWNQCVLQVFDRRDHGRFSLPELYINGLRNEYTSDDERRHWHATAADILGRPRGGSVFVDDVVAAVLHRRDSGNFNQALADACSWLAVACTSAPPAAQQFILRRLALAVTGIAEDKRTAVAIRLRWYSLLMHFGRQLLPGVAETAAENLARLLSGDELKGAGDDLGHAALFLLLYAAIENRNDLAEAAVDHLPPGLAKEVSENMPGGIAFPYLAAHLRAEAGPLDAVLRVLAELERFASAADQLWLDEHGYEFWRSVETSIYVAIERLARSDPNAAQHEIEKLQKAGQLAGQIGAPQVAAVLWAGVVRVLIDVERDLQGAVEAASRFPECGDGADGNVRAYISHVRGDALRCHEQFPEAEVTYRAALGLWSDDAVWDRSQTYLMLGFVLSRQGRDRDAYGLVLESVALQEQSPGPVPRTQARSLSEAAVIAMRDGHQDDALDCLMRMARLLEENYRHTPEWVLLAQLSHILARLAGPGMPEPELPVTGQSLGLPEVVPGAEDMAPSAPFVMLGLACASCRRSDTALGYYERALAECPEHLTAPTAQLALAAALDAGQLEPAVRYSALSLDETALSAGNPEITGMAREFVRALAGRVVGLAVNALGTAGDEQVISKALSELDRADTGYELVHVIRRVLTAFLKVASDAGPSAAESLDSAVQFSLEHEVYDIARRVAEYWCYHYHPGRPASWAEVLLWHCRLCWLTLAVGRSDSDFLAGVVGREKRVWHALADANPDSDSADILKELCEECRPDEMLRSLTARLFRHLVPLQGIARLLAEIAHVAEACRDAGILGGLHDAVAVRTLDVILTGGIFWVRDDILRELCRFRERLDGEQIIGVTELQTWRRLFDRLIGLTGLVTSPVPVPGSLDLLLDMEQYVSRLSAESQAQWHIWLRFALGGESGPQRFDAICDRLLSDRATELTVDPDVPLRSRLLLRMTQAVCRGHRLVSELASALGSRNLQHDANLPVQFPWRQTVEDQLKRALREINVWDEHFQELINETENDSDDERLLCSFLNERGSLRELIGRTLGQLREGADGDVWLNRALVDLTEAIRAAEKGGDREGLYRSAAGALGIARRLGFDDRVAELTLVIDAGRQDLGDDHPLITLINRLDELDNRSYRDGITLPGKAIGEDELARLVDEIMRAFGLPEDRRVFVYQDALKFRRMDEVRRTFCRHLAPLQSLDHTISRDTAYTEPTRYVGCCELLGHQARIECADIDAVIEVFKGQFCLNCPHREPEDSSS